MLSLSIEKYICCSVFSLEFKDMTSAVHGSKKASKKGRVRNY